MPAKRRKAEERPLPTWAVQDGGRDAEEAPLIEASLPAWADQDARRGAEDEELFASDASEPDDAMLDDVRRAMELEGADARRDRKRARRASGESEPEPNWSAQDERRVRGGAELWKYIMLLYTLTKITAKDVCVLMYWCFEAGATAQI